MPKQNCVECGKEYIEAVYHHRGYGFRYDKSFSSYMCNDCREEASRSMPVVATAKFEKELTSIHPDFAEESYNNKTYQQNCEEASVTYQEATYQEEAREKQKARELLKDEFQAKDRLVRELEIQLGEEKQKNQILQQKLEKTLISLKGIVREVVGQ